MDAWKVRKLQAGRLGRFGREAWPLGVLALLCLGFYWDVLWLPADRTILGDDATNLFLTWLRFAVSSLREGHLPLWNPYAFSGITFVGNPQPALFYPPTWLALAMPVTRAMGLIAVSHLWLAGAGMYLWLRSEGGSRAGGLLGGAVLAFGGYFAVRVRGGHLGVITTGAWLPFLLWAYRQASLRRSWRWAIAGGVPVGLSILGGHTASFAYVALGLVGYAVFHVWQSWQETRSAQQALLPVGWVGVMLLVGLVVAAVQLLPMVELALLSTRRGAASYDFAARFSWPPGFLVTLLIPNFFGEPSHTGYWGDGIYDEFIFYVGVLPLILTLLGLRLRHRLTPLLVALGLGALLLAFGEYGGLHPLLYRFIPFFQVMRAPARAGYLFSVVAAAFAGLMLTTLASSARERRSWLLGPMGWPLVLTVAGGALALVIAGFVAFGLGRETNPAVGRLWHQANQTALFLVAFLLASGLLMVWKGADRFRPAYGLWALGLVMLDLWTFGGSVITEKSVPESGYWRIVSQAVVDPQVERVLPWGLAEAEQNGGMIYGLRSVFAYDPLILQRYEDFITSRPDPLARTYDLLNAGYLVTTGAQEFDGPDAPSLVMEQSGVYVYRRPNRLPRAWVAPQIEVLDEGSILSRIHDPAFEPRTTALVDPATGDGLECGGSGGGGQAEITEYGTNRIAARVRGEGGFLVFSEVDYPGWRASLDGEPVQLVRADYLLRALCVPAGEHHVEMVYDPPLLKLGLALTTSGLLAALVALVWRRRTGVGAD
jgi:hypothetical protein